VTAHGQNPAASAWDGDGGHSADYSSIPRLRWTGPGEPGTYKDYLAARSQAPFRAELVHSGVSTGRDVPRGGARASKALVLVENGLYNGIQTNLAFYVADLQADGYAVEVHTITGGTYEDLKNFILNNQTDLVGCVFFGNLPAAWFEFDYWGAEEFPCDLYFMDLDGDWIDSDNDDKWDAHTAGTGDVGPEIFVGRIDASMMTGDEVTMTNDYLDKVIAYRNGGINVPAYGLTYTEDDWAVYMDMRTDIKFAYPDFDDVPAPATNAADYRDNRVPDPDYEFIQLCCHSSSTGHAFTRGGWVSNWDIIAAVPHAMFFNLFCCSSLRFTTQDFLGGAYIYNTSQTTLAVIGSTKTGSMLEFYAFYQPFGSFESFGESFRQWFNFLAPYSNDEIAWHYGMTIAGDPFLTMLEPALVMSFPEGLPDRRLPPGPETHITVEIVPGEENYVPGSGLLHYRFDPASAFSTAALAPLGGNLHEAVLPGTRPGDEPEFYFSAQGDGGSTITSPADAPNSVYSFEIGIVETIFHDDFESDLGWFVENINLADGPWERGIPAGGGDRGDPPSDFDGSGSCYVTDNADGDSDVDGGPTRLMSPVIDLATGDAEISYARWHYNDDNNDEFTVEISNDGGSSWTVVETVKHTDGWNTVGFMVSDFVSPTARVKLRFSAIDDPNDSVTEAGLDAVSVGRVYENPSVWAEAYEFSAASGCSIPIHLDAGSSHASREYLLGGSTSGSSPGMQLPGGNVIPLNWDWFTSYILNHLGSPVFQGFKGFLDGQGQAMAVLNVPAGAASAYTGKTLTFAFTLTASFDYVSNPMFIVIEP
jgi:hypothetical protein